ncbi:MAG: bifunctional 5,10-methylenetetrahydrofolate dehydrogenase/5,10-methenyltetrahydrofolate cyclohydrolase [Euryarchaeota archaeon]|nr:bifunctional 5,10-methylenetetrahydrofolate dehydrogenase/5,10-methenyltetrahydrofolate cyclohydrolase [Euryarchaeota archaeon]MDE1835124.1 bifunctional 5,10-methylenetetrahydrofolate dehydrogenase/5,10-methenyltetrahydrofolate cyclohydrolase [Euryarchaeota archaeon]MDE1880690.1 bifunctional 5,10-methylenetetrahydrofolate dehydrogenase/5,10-methenyltetrahydrofolate cyclohydrolase [Euryarchaeota archaeon]MDE2044913.1 bifunctional 5,10-methylenetetrahydrofolate dehydrogenase/5,10-methenyltetrah
MVANPAAQSPTARWEGKKLAEEIYERTTARIDRALAPGRAPPRLASIAVGEGGPFNVYQRQQAKMAAKAHIAFLPSVLPATVGQRELEEKVRALDQDPTVCGVILQHPLPHGLDFLRAVSLLRPEKDVDGVGSENLGRLAAHRPVQVPAVALASRDLLLHYGVRPEGRTVVVVGRSETVGVPTALLFLLRGNEGDATVTIAHSRSKDLDSVLRTGEIIISCVGRPGLLTRANVAQRAYVVDVGLTTTSDPSRPTGVLMQGDANASSLQGWASALTPVPGGVGPVTVANLMANCARGYELLAGTS